MPADANALSVSPATGPSPDATAQNTPFPVFLKLESRRVLLVGGGPAALEKLATVLRSSPATAVTVVAPTILPALRELAARHPQVQLHQRPYHNADLDGHDLLFLATNDPALHRYIATAAAQRRLLICVDDAPDLCDFHLASALPNSGRAMVVSARPVPAYETPATAYWRRVATGALSTFALFIFMNILSYYITWQQAWDLARSSGTFYTFVAVGFVAQLIDGMLGMGYGVVSAISLMSLGLSPVSVSASIHTAEMFASGASGYQHYRFGNVNKKLFRVLLLPGIAGSIGGAYLLSRFGEEYANWVKPLLAAYLLVLGLRILSKALRSQRAKRRKVKNAGWLAGVGGFLDSFGGGGWGPLVTSTLITNGRTPRFVIGTVSLVEFFVTFASAFTFFAMKGLSHWQIVAGLIVGGVAAAPLAARLAGRISTRWMFVGVGLMVMVWSLWALRKVFF